MRLLAVVGRLSGLAVATAMGLGCGSEDATAGTGDSATGAGGAGGLGATVSSTTSGAGGFVTTSSGGSGGMGPSVLYAHSNTALYEGDPTVTPLALAALGDFDCIGGQDQSTSMTDVAVNAAGEVWAISTTRIYRLELGSGVHCAETIALNNPQGTSFYGLTFAPKGVLAPDAEMLIAGNSAGELWSIDGSGGVQKRGTLGVVPPDDGHGHTYDNAGKPWELSGDIAFFDNRGAPVGFATVRDCPDPPSTQGCNTIDTLIDLDVAALATANSQSVQKSVRGQIVRGSGCADAEPGYGSVYGIAAWLGDVYGFSRKSGDGYAIKMSNVDGTACLIQAFSGVPWAGAGVTTVAPIIAPPK